MGSELLLTGRGKAILAQLPIQSLCVLLSHTHAHTHKNRIKSNNKLSNFYIYHFSHTKYFEQSSFFITRLIRILVFDWSIMSSTGLMSKVQSHLLLLCKILPVKSKHFNRNSDHMLIYTVVHGNAHSIYQTTELGN